MPQGPKLVFAGSPHAFGRNVDSDGHVCAGLLPHGGDGLGNVRQGVVVVDDDDADDVRHGSCGDVVVGCLDGEPKSQGGVCEDSPHREVLEVNCEG
jgi:hypothetical protein